MSSEHEKIVGLWFDKAEADLTAANILFESNPLVLDIVCFHCQQAVEKYLKGFLVFYDVEFPKTHILEYLIKLCSKVDPVFNTIELNELSQFAVRARYPHDSYAPEREETFYYLELGQNVRELVIMKINQVFSLNNFELQTFNEVSF